MTPSCRRPTRCRLDRPDAPGVRLGSLTTFSGLDIFDLAWLVGMTAVALVLFGRRGGRGRVAGALLVLLYAAFLAIQVTARPR
jgi:hypothetical protein